MDVYLRQELGQSWAVPHTRERSLWSPGHGEAKKFKVMGKGEVGERKTFQTETGPTENSEGESEVSMEIVMLFLGDVQANGLHLSSYTILINSMLISRAFVFMTSFFF